MYVGKEVSQSVKSMSVIVITDRMYVRYNVTSGRKIRILEQEVTHNIVHGGHYDSVHVPFNECFRISLNSLTDLARMFGRIFHQRVEDSEVSAGIPWSRSQTTLHPRMSVTSKSFPIENLMNNSYSRLRVLYEFIPSW